MAGENCRGCNRSMKGNPFSICPNCGRYMATRTGAEVAAVFGLSFVVAIVVVVGLVVLLWNFA